MFRSEILLAWLNQNVGAQWATYIGVTVGIAALFGGRKVIADRRRKVVGQRANVKGGKAIQISNVRNSNIEIKSISPDAIRAVVESAVSPLADNAREVARSEVKQLLQDTGKKLEERIDRIEKEKLTRPDVQFAVADAIKGAARRGGKVNIDILSDLLTLRVEKDNSDLFDLSIDKAISIIPTLTYEMICTIVTVQFVQHLEIRNQALPDIERMFEIVYKEFASKCEGITETTLITIASVGAGTYMRIMGLSTFGEFQKKYPLLNTPNAEKEFPFVVKTLHLYDRQGLHKLSLSASGRVIALIMLSRHVQGIGDLKSLIG